MSVLGHIGRDIDKKIITALLRAGDGQRLLEMLAEAPGVLSVSHHHARGVGNRRVRSRQLYFREHDVLLVLAEASEADSVFARIYTEGRLGEHGTGMIFMEKVLRGHPMMPLDLADW
jgi:nitrogen regulatory protein PII